MGSPAHRASEVEDTILAAEAADFKLSLPASSRASTPLVVLLGWLGCEDRWLAKYSGFLEDAGYSTVRAICPSSALVWPTPGRRRTFVNDLLRFLQIVNHGAPERPVVFYAFSNGGALPLESINDMLEQGHWSQTAKTLKPSLQTAGLIFDSAPCYLHPWVGARSVGEGKSWFLKIFLALVFYVSVFIGIIYDAGRPQKFWSKMKTLNGLGGSSTPTLYLYSQNDRLCDAKLLDSLIASRKASGHDVLTCKWETSAHVAHLVVHPHQYKIEVLQFLNRISRKSKLPPDATLL